MKKLLKRFAFLTAGCLLFSLTACDVSNDKEKDPTPYPVQVANVTVKQTPKKVASLSPALTELLFEQGYGDQIVVRTDDASYPEEAKSLPSAGTTGHIDMEKLLLAEPDTVLTHEALSKREMDTLEKAGCQVIVLPMAGSLSELQTLYENIGLLFEGGITGKSKGDAIYQKIESALDAIKAKLPKEVSFLYLIDLKGVGATGDTFESDLLSLFGTNVAAADTDYEIDMKSLAEKNPDIILIAEPYGLPHLQENANTKNLSAVKNKKVYSVDSTLFAVQSTRITEAVRQIAETLYPEQFPEEETSDPSSGAGASEVETASAASGTKAK